MTPIARAIFGAVALYARLAPTERGGYALARFARRFIPRSQWNSTFTTPNGIRLDLDLATYPDCCMAMGLYELDTMRILRRLLSPGKWFIDGGANLGYFTLAAAKLVGPTGRVDSYEPDPQNRLRLQSHLTANASPQHVHVHPAALSDTAGTIDIIHPPSASATNHGQSSIYRSLVPDGQPHSVPTVRLDQDLPGIPNLIKLDVEGAELSAITGMTALLTSPNPPALIVEHNHVTATAAGFTMAQLFETIQKIQPKYQIDWIGSRLRPIDSPSELQAISRQGNLLIHIQPP